MTDTENPTITVVMSQDRVITVNFTAPGGLQTLTAEASPPAAGTVTIGTPCSSLTSSNTQPVVSFQCAAGTEVSLTATPKAGCAFSRWGGDINSTDMPLSVALGGDKTVTAIFTPLEPLVADFQVSSVKSQEGQIMAFFTNNSSGGVPPLTYAWDFENDGTIDTAEREPWHCYVASGTYTVGLTVTDSLGFSDVKVRSNCVTILSSDGGSAEIGGGQVRMEFPYGAVASAAMVTIEARATDGLPEAPRSFTIGDTCFVISALDADTNEPLTPSEPATITVKYSEADLASADGNPDHLVLAYWDEAASRWETVKTSADTTSMTLSASTSHLSTWVVLAKTASASSGLPTWSRALIAVAAVIAACTVAFLATRR